MVMIKSQRKCTKGVAKERVREYYKDRTKENARRGQEQCGQYQNERQRSEKVSKGF